MKTFFFLAFSFSSYDVHRDGKLQTCLVNGAMVVILNVETKLTYWHGITNIH